jgi:hypothetical protein
MEAAFSVILSVIAIGLSIYVFFDSRGRDRRDMYLKIHEYLVRDDVQRGRYLLFEKVTDEKSIDLLSDQEYLEVNRALITYNALGLYVKNGYVKEQDAMELWAMPIYRAWRAAQPFIAHRETSHGPHPWIYFEFLAQQAEKDLVRKGVPLQFTVQHRSQNAE